MDGDVEDVSFLPGDTDTLNRKSKYEPSMKQKCRQLVLSKGKASACLVVIGVFILVIAVLASFARPGSGASPPCVIFGADKLVTTTPPPLSYLSINGEPFPWKDIRLPRNVLPETYHISFHPDFQKRVFSGKVDITVNIMETTDTIVLHSKDLNITMASVTGHTVVKQLEYLEHQQLLLKTNNKLVKGDKPNVTLHFQGKLVKKLSGFYLSSYKTPSNEIRYLGTTQFESTGAREAFPCFDEPDMKAQFGMKITRTKDRISLFNMPLKSKTDADNDLEVDEFELSVKMSTYLVAFIVCDFKEIHGKTDDGITNVSVYAPEHQIQMGTFALEAAIKVLNSYNKLFGIKYPLPKQDLVAVPDFEAGAMENWGLITYRMTTLLYDEKVSSAYNKQKVAIVVAHELAHQWFGNLVTLKWWNDLWLNEGFASYVEYLGSNKVDSNFQIMEQFVLKDLIKAMKRDSLQRSHPIDVPVKDPEQISNLFDDISYEKGASVIRMLENFMGQQKFLKGINSYLNKYKYSNAVTADLWSSLDEFAPDNVNVKAVMDTWTKQMGYPVIMVTKTDNKYNLIQKRFLLFKDPTLKEKYESPFDYKWIVPFQYQVRYENGEDMNSLQWLNMTNGEFYHHKEVKWIKGNTGMFGYYRVNYDDNIWQELTQQLMEDHLVFNATDRAGLIDDACHIGRSGGLSQTTVLQITKYLKKERSYLPWSVALSCLNFIARRMDDYVVYDKIKAYILDLMTPLLEQLSWERPLENATQLDIFLQQLILEEAISLNHKASVTKALEQFHNWKNNNHTLFVELKSVIFRVGAQYGDDDDWLYIWNKYLNALVPSEQETLLVSLCYSNNGVFISRLLNLALEGKDIRQQDFSSVVAHVGFKSAGRIMAWRTLQRNWNKVLRWFGRSSFTLSYLIKETTMEFSSEFDYQEVSKFFDTHDAGSGFSEVAASLERIRMNIEWLTENEKKITDWFNNNTG